MKILHYIHGLPPVRDGGLVKYALDLAEGERESGNEVHLLIPGKFSIRGRRETRIVSGYWNGFSCHSIINPLLVTEGARIDDVECMMAEGDANVYFSFLQEICPDIIHVHSLMGIHLSFFVEAKKLLIPIVFTTHDYYGLCPKITLYRNDGICDMSDWDICVQCMGTPISKKKLEWKHSDLCRVIKKNRLYRWLEYSKTLLPYKRMIRNAIKGRKSSDIVTDDRKNDKKEKYNALCEYYYRIFMNITYFHFNSRQSREVYESFLGNIQGKVVSITNKRVNDHRKINTYLGKMKIGYLSSKQAFKGYGYLIEALDAMYKAGMTDFECHIYFNPQDINCPYICSHAPFQEKDMESVFENIDVLVMPSLWKETFGMVVLEALSYGVPVIVSSYVGAKELLEDQQGMGMIIDIEKNKGRLQEVLEKIYCDRKILSQMNEQICKWNKDDWGFDRHIGRIMNLYSDLLMKVE